VLGLVAATLALAGALGWAVWHAVAWAAATVAGR
jgi:hypothetical protein